MNFWDQKINWSGYTKEKNYEFLGSEFSWVNSWTLKTMKRTAMLYTTIIPLSEFIMVEDYRPKDNHSLTSEHREPSHMTVPFPEPDIFSYTPHSVFSYSSWEEMADPNTTTIWLLNTRNHYIESSLVSWLLSTTNNQVESSDFLSLTYYLLLHPQS